MSAIPSEDGRFNRRLGLALACSRGAMHLYEYVRPTDGRLRAALDLATESLTRQPETQAVKGDPSTLFSAMWEVERARTDVESGDHRDIILLAIDSVILLCRAALGELEGEPRDNLDIEAFQSCWYAAEAFEHAFRVNQRDLVTAIPVSVLIGEDVHAISEAFLVWHTYWDERRLASRNQTE